MENAAPRCRSPLQAIALWRPSCRRRCRFSLRQFVGTPGHRDRLDTDDAPTPIAYPLAVDAAHRVSPQARVAPSCYPPFRAAAAHRPPALPPCGISDAGAALQHRSSHSPRTVRLPLFAAAAAAGIAPACRTWTAVAATALQRSEAAIRWLRYAQGWLMQKQN